MELTHKIKRLYMQYEHTWNKDDAEEESGFGLEKDEEEQPKRFRDDFDWRKGDGEIKNRDQLVKGNDHITRVTSRFFFLFPSQLLHCEDILTRWSLDFWCTCLYSWTYEDII